MINSLVLGNKYFPVNIIQGPLAGVSTAPFRLLTWEYSKPAFSCTEMISCKTLIHQSKISHERFVKKNINEGPVCFQLAGHDPEEIALATQIVTQYGADLIDLNCGCPVKKIRRKGAGSSLLSNDKKLYQLIRAMKENTHVPVSVKIRVESQDEKFNQRLATVIGDAGADFLIVHGRHWTEHYETPCRYDDIQFFVDNLKIPVIGNGDIGCIDSLKKMFATKCHGVMISRSGVGQPWLIKKLISEMSQENFMIPAPSEIGNLFLRHIIGLIALLGNEKFAIIQARKLAKYYARTLAAKSEFCAEINKCENLAHFQKICEKFFDNRRN